MKFELNEYHRNSSDDELIEDLRNVAHFFEEKYCYIERIQ